MFAITLDHITVAYHDTQVVVDVTASIPQGVLLALVGPNGAGKTTLLQSMVGLITPTHGTVSFFGGTFAQHRHRIAYVPQRTTVDWDFPALVIDVVLMGCYQRLKWYQHPGIHERQQALQALEHVGMADYAQRPIGQLSGGQQQRVFLARALMQEADMYLLDEPFAGIDAVTEKTIITLLKTLRAEGKTIVVVHHDLQTLQDYFDWLLLMNTHCIAYGPTKHVLKQDYFAAAYGRKNPCLRQTFNNLTL